MRVAFILILCVLFGLHETVQGAPKSAAQMSQDKKKESFLNGASKSSSQMSADKGWENVSKGASKSAAQISQDRDRELFSLQQKLAKMYENSPSEFLDRYFKNKWYSSGTIKPCEHIKGIVQEVSEPRSIKVRWIHTAARVVEKTTLGRFFENSLVETYPVEEVINVVNVDTTGISVGSGWDGFVTGKGQTRNCVQPIQTLADLSKIKATGFDLVKYAAESESKKN